MKKDYKKDFPLLLKHPGLVYLDSAATSQKPKQVISAIEKYLSNYNSNIHRGIYRLSEQSTEIYENTRQNVALWIGANSPKEIVFTTNASEAINLVAYGWAKKFLRKGDVIVTSILEHHSNFVPWLRLKEEMGLKLIVLPIKEDFGLDYEALFKIKADLKKVKLVALSHASNVLGSVNPVSKIIKTYTDHGIKAKYLIDSAQSIPHLPVNVKKMKCDFLVFSSHKMLGPSGVGVLWAKKDILYEMDPLFSGSNMISQVTTEKAIWAESPGKFETGTGRLEGAAGLTAAINYLQKAGLENIMEYEKWLTEYMLQMLKNTKNLKIFGKETLSDRLGVFSFNVGKVHPHDAGEILNRDKICVRTGYHCAEPLIHSLGSTGNIRASLYIYNTREDIDKLEKGIYKINKIFNNG